MLPFPPSSRSSGISSGSLASIGAGHKLSADPSNARSAADNAFAHNGNASDNNNKSSALFDFVWTGRDNGKPGTNVMI
jgi:hypothetical protein